MTKNDDSVGTRVERRSDRYGIPTRLGLACADCQHREVLEPEEWQAAYLLANRPLPKQSPRLNAARRLIAQLGVYWGRKSDGEPGMKTLSLGLQRVMDFAAGIQFAGRLMGDERCVMG